MLPNYHLAIPHLPYDSTEAGTNVPPIAPNKLIKLLKHFKSFLNCLRAFLRVPSSTSDRVGPGTEVLTKVQLIV